MAKPRLQLYWVSYYKRAEKGANHAAHEKNVILLENNDDFVIHTLW
jgi:hypothetical protein